MNDKVHQLEAHDTNWGELQGKQVQFNDGEGALYVKFVALTPGTLKENPNLQGMVESQPGFIYVGSLDEIKKALVEGFEEMQAEYKKAVDEFNKGE